jgi:activator of HSP90 ATPase
MSHVENARVTTFVAVSPTDAFEVFTQEIDVWWRRGPRFRHGKGEDSELSFEQLADGRRLVERYAGKLFEIGRVRVWEPGARLVFDWRASNFAPGESTEVELRFEPFADGTRVTLEHRGWENIRGDHPVRHGTRERAFAAMIGGYWGELLTALRLYTRATRA